MAAGKGKTHTNHGGRHTKSAGRGTKIVTDFGLDNASMHGGSAKNECCKELKGSVTDLSASFSGSSVKRIK